MTAKAGQISEALQRILGIYGLDIVAVYLCKVDSVSDTDRTCDVTTIHSDATISITEVQLSAAKNDGMILYPAIDSLVMVGVTVQQKAFVLMTSDLQRASIIIDKTTFEMTNTGMILNDGSYGGLVMVNDLVTRLNTLENDLNTIKAAFSSWVVVPNDGGAALKTIAAAWYAQTITPTVAANIENTTITHGHI